MIAGPRRTAAPRLATVASVAVMLLAGCSSSSGTTSSSPTDTLPVTRSTTEQPPSSASSMSSDPMSLGSTTVETPSGTPTPTTSGEPSSAPTTSGEPPAAPSTYVPPPDGTPTDGDCPYLDGDRVAFDTGQHIGQTQIIPGSPQPICIFVRTDGQPLATIRALQFDTPRQAQRAVDYYAPRDTSSLETKPAGWEGGSLRTDDGGSVYAVSKDGYAVIATCNVMTVAARQLVVHAVEGLGW